MNADSYHLGQAKIVKRNEDVVSSSVTNNLLTEWEKKRQNLFLVVLGRSACYALYQKST